MGHRQKAVGDISKLLNKVRGRNDLIIRRKAEESISGVSNNRTFLGLRIVAWALATVGIIHQRSGRRHKFREASKNNSMGTSHQGSSTWFFKDPLD
jgi:hypothetical protein